MFIETKEHCGDHIRIQYIHERGRKCCDDDGCNENIFRAMRNAVELVRRDVGLRE
jgi:hypothetical protein